MPAAYAHEVFGQKVERALPSGMQTQIRAERDLYHIGLQGPDILFYYHPLKANPVSRLGNEMHTQSGREFFSAALKRLPVPPIEEDAARVYLCGMLCHYVLDSRCHGYINEQVKKTGVSHYEIEGELDRSLLVSEGRNPNAANVVRNFHYSPRSAQIISRFYPGITPETMGDALKDFVMFHDLLRCASDSKRNFIYAGLKVMGQYENLKGHVINKKENPKCHESSAWLMRELESAVPEAAELISDPDFEGALSSSRFDLNYNGVKP